MRLSALPDAAVMGPALVRTVFLALTLLAAVALLPVLIRHWRARRG